MKKLLSILSIMTLSVMLFAQAPQSFSYQTVIRDASWTVLDNQSVGIKISIREDVANGNIVYEETHSATTSTIGLVNLSVGGGVVVNGVFNTIDWGNHAYFIEVAVDVTGGSNYQVMGTTQLRSVPYALYAKTSGTPGATGPQGPPGVDGIDGTNGTDGVDGNDGAPGSQGIQGLPGAIGATGPPGADGIDGAVGATGNDGAVGATGPAGNDGVDGTDGVDGAPGVDGTNGTNGIDGVDGSPGPQGPQGVTGNTGQQGPQGVTGNTGQQGPQGHTGPAFINCPSVWVNGEYDINKLAAGPNGGGEYILYDGATEVSSVSTWLSGSNQEVELSVTETMGSLSVTSQAQVDALFPIGTTIFIETAINGYPYNYIKFTTTTAIALSNNPPAFLSDVMTASSITDLAGIGDISGTINIYACRPGTQGPAGPAGDSATSSRIDSLESVISAQDSLLSILIAEPTYSIGDAAQGGIVFYVSPDGKNGLVAATVDQSTSSNWYDAQDYISNPSNHTIEGHKFRDWRLPTKYELNQMYLNIGQGNALGLGNIGVFASNYYWSSAENDYANAWVQDFTSGYQGIGDKDYDDSVRAVRAF